LTKLSKVTTVSWRPA